MWYCSSVMYYMEEIILKSSSCLIYILYLGVTTIHVNYIAPFTTKYPLCNTISKVSLFSQKLICWACWNHNFIKYIFLYHLIYVILKLKLRNRKKQKPTTKPKGEPSLSTERSWTYWDWNYMVWLLLKNGKLINCYQSYLSYFILIFLIYQNILLQRRIITILDLIKHKMVWILEMLLYAIN